MKFEDKKLGYMLKPHRDGLCFQVYRWVPAHRIPRGRYMDRTSKPGWKRMEQYAATFDAGLRRILDLAVNADPSEVSGVDEGVRRIAEIRDSITNAMANIPGCENGGCTCGRAV